MAPGAMTAATIAYGAKNPKAGLLISIGHGIVEFPLIIFLVFGLAAILQAKIAQTAIGIAGGVFLIYIAVSMFIDARKPASQTKPRTSGPVITGIVLTASNPYFLLWWATVGVLLAIDAKELGIVSFVLFAVTHWLCDVIWLSILSFASYKGTSILGPQIQKYILYTCGLILVSFAIKFILNAVNSL
jgi:threonine/homoserine/homoserine lactone efflux protein